MCSMTSILIHFCMMVMAATTEDLISTPLVEWKAGKLALNDENVERNGGL